MFRRPLLGALLLIAAAGWVASGAALAQSVPPKDDPSPETQLATIEAAIASGQDKLKAASETLVEATAADDEATLLEARAKALRAEATAKRIKANPDVKSAQADIATQVKLKAELERRLLTVKDKKAPLPKIQAPITETDVAAAQAKVAETGKKLERAKKTLEKLSEVATAAKKAWSGLWDTWTKTPTPDNHVATEGGKGVYKEKLKEKALGQTVVLATEAEATGLTAQRDSLKARIPVPVPVVDTSNPDRFVRTFKSGKYVSENKPKAFVESLGYATWCQNGRQYRETIRFGTVRTGNIEVSYRFYPTGGTNSDGSRFGAGWWEESRRDVTPPPPPPPTTVYYLYRTQSGTLFYSTTPPCR